MEEVTIRVTVDDVFDCAAEPPSETPAVVRDGVKWLNDYLTERGYEDVHPEFLKNPRSTDEGRLYAEGTFVGPSPNGGDDRPVDDFSDDYRFLVVESRDYEDKWLVEVYFRTAHLATFEVGSDKLKLLQGEIEPIE